MRKLLLRIIVVFALFASCVSVVAGEIRLSVGRKETLVLPENPSTGYSWKIDQEGSDNLSILSIEDLGHQRGAHMPGAPGLRRWVIRARAPGHASLQLVYQRPWEPEPVETRRIGINVP